MLKDQLALGLGRLAWEILGRRSTSLPGVIAQKISPSLLDTLLQKAEPEPVYITGTNGKSSTAGILANILTLSRSLVHNFSGANMSSGLLTSLLTHQHNLQDKQILFEVDEAFLRLIAHKRAAKAIIVNNFFRDQLDRFGEVQQTVDLVQSGLKLSQSGCLIANADDPYVSQLKSEKIIYFGLEAEDLEGEIFSEELGVCPECHSDLIYQSQWLAQLGDYACSRCDFRRPKPHISISDIDLHAQGSDFSLKLPENKILNIHLSLPGLFNIYNALAAAACAHYLGIASSDIKAGIEGYKSLFGRSQKIQYKDKDCQIFLIKNPIGASEVLRILRKDRKASILIIINDNYADGRDISWLWDAHFEILAEHVGKISISGSRGLDMALRLKYAGVSKVSYYRDYREALTDMTNQSTSEKIYILPTYTALLALTKFLQMPRS